MSKKRNLFELEDEDPIKRAEEELKDTDDQIKIAKIELQGVNKLKQTPGKGPSPEIRNADKKQYPPQALSKSKTVEYFTDQRALAAARLAKLKQDKTIKTSGGEPTVENKIIKMAKLTKEQILNMVESQEPARMTKRELIESISHRLLNEDMDDELRNKIERGESGYSEHLDPETIKRMANDIMRDAKANIESKGGQANLDGAQNILSQGLMGALPKERAHKRELERLAVKLVTQEYNIPQDAVDFEVEITGHPQLGGTEIQKRGLKIKKGTKQPPQGKTAEELKPNVTKRRFMNAMMHGAARKGQNLFHLATNELNRIDPTLINDYSKLMAGNDFMYWAIGDERIAEESESGTHAGQVRVYPNGNPPEQGSKPKIVAQGMTFPFLLHELTKGVLELISQWGREADKETRDYVEDKTDNLESEPWDIRLGSKIWEKLLEAMDVDALPYKTQIFTALSSLPATEFNGIVSGLLNDSEEARDEIKDIVYNVIKEENEYELEQSLKQYREPEGPNPDDDEGPLAPEGPEGPEEDDILAQLLGKKDEPGEDNPENWSIRDLENARDEALDTRDYKAVAYLQTILDSKL